MSYLIELTPQAETDIEKHKKSGDKKVLVKIDKLLDELREHPTSGTGKPEQLKHYNPYLVKKNYRQAQACVPHRRRPDYSFSTLVLGAL